MRIPYKISLTDMPLNHVRRAKHKTGDAMHTPMSTCSHYTGTACKLVRIIQQSETNVF